MGWLIMPGISLTLSNNKDLDRVSIEKAEKSIMFFDDYKVENIYDQPEIKISYSGYNSYPVHHFENSRFLIVVEGLIYNRGDDHNREMLFDIAESFVSLDNNLTMDGAGFQKIKSFVKGTDGEYVVLCLDKEQKKGFIFNDGLGRLPLFVSFIKNVQCVSREIRYIISFLGKVESDKALIAQGLLLGYTLNDGTYYKNIKKMPPGCVFEIGPNVKELKWYKTFELNLDGSVENSPEPAGSIENLGNLWIETCKRRASTHQFNILSLSGGLDSRTVAAGLIRSKSKFQSISFIDGSSVSSRDAMVARRIAKLNNFQWELIRLPPLRSEKLQNQFDRRCGMSHLAIAYLLPFEEYILERFKRKSCGFSGDGGDKALPYLLNEKPITSERELLDKILQMHSFTMLKSSKVSEITGLSEEEMFHSITDVLGKYPEQSWDGKFLHFTVYERGLKLMAEGPERVRYFHWAHSPFYSLQFFETAISLPQNIKYKNRFYRRFLEHLSPSISRVPYANTSRPYNTFMQNADVYVRYLFLEQIRKAIDKILTKAGIKKNYRVADKMTKLEYLKNLIEMTPECKEISDKLSGKDMVIGNSRIDTLLTFAAVLDLTGRTLK